MATIWAVSEGDYSDYRVTGVFSSEKKAEAYLAVVKEENYAGPYRLEELEYDPDPPTLVSTITVYIAKDGNVLPPKHVRVREVAWVGFGGYYATPGHFVIFPKRPEIPDRPVYLAWTVQTDDIERAVKVVNEKRAMLMAAGVWGDTTKTRELLGI